MPLRLACDLLTPCAAKGSVSTSRTLSAGLSDVYGSWKTTWISFASGRRFLRGRDLGIQRIFLNGEKTFNLGIVDQGFWPDGLYSAPTDEAMRFDIALAKAMGFNSIRKHLKIEPERWYAECDRIGLLVWQDMPSGSNDDALARAHFERELDENITQLGNHPSIICWVPFNEG